MIGNTAGILAVMGFLLFGLGIPTAIVIIGTRMKEKSLKNK